MMVIMIMIMSGFFLVKHDRDIEVKVRGGDVIGVLRCGDDYLVLRLEVDEWEMQTFSKQVLD